MIRHRPRPEYRGHKKKRANSIPPHARETRYVKRHGPIHEGYAHTYRKEETGVHNKGGSHIPMPSAHYGYSMTARYCRLLLLLVTALQLLRTEVHPGLRNTVQYSSMSTTASTKTCSTPQASADDVRFVIRVIIAEPLLSVRGQLSQYSKVQDPRATYDITSSLAPY